LQEVLQKNEEVENARRGAELTAQQAMEMQAAALEPRRSMSPMVDGLQRKRSRLTSRMLGVLTRRSFVHS